LVIGRQAGVIDIKVDRALRSRRASEIGKLTRRNDALPLKGDAPLSNEVGKFVLLDARNAPTQSPTSELLSSRGSGSGHAIIGWLVGFNCGIEGKYLIARLLVH